MTRTLRTGPRCAAVCADGLGRARSCRWRGAPTVLACALRGRHDRVPGPGTRMGPLKMPRLDFAGPAWAVLPGVVGAITVALEVVGGAGGGGLLASAGPGRLGRREETTVSASASSHPRYARQRIGRTATRRCRTSTCLPLELSDGADAEPPVSDLPQEWCLGDYVDHVPHTGGGGRGRRWSQRPGGAASARRAAN